MDQRHSDTSEVVRLAPRSNTRDRGDPIDTVGRALVALLQEAATHSRENVDRAMTAAYKLLIQLRAAEDRIKELEAEIKRLEGRATRAEGWLHTIKTEIEEMLIGPSRPIGGLPALH